MISAIFMTIDGGRASSAMPEQAGGDHDERNPVQP